MNGKFALLDPVPISQTFILLFKLIFLNVAVMMNSLLEKRSEDISSRFHMPIKSHTYRVIVSGRPWVCKFNLVPPITSDPFKII